MWAHKPASDASFSARRFGDGGIICGTQQSHHPNKTEYEHKTAYMRPTNRVLENIGDKGRVRVT